MKATRLTAIATLAALALLVAVAPADRAQVATNQAVLTSVCGDVQTRHGTGGYHPARLNEVLEPGDGIKTGASSRAELSVGEGGYVRMAESSQVLVTALDASGTTSFQHVVGGIWVTIERTLGGASKFEVRMPSAVASVTGTVFRCQLGEEGNCDTYVYEGEVEIEAGDQRMRVTPDERCRVPRDLRTVVERFNLTGDDAAAWVMYNRHRDIVRHLGDPQIIVALREQDLSELGAYLASRAVAGQLALHGLHSTSVVEAGVTDFSFNPDGTISWGRTPTADYCVIGDVGLEQLRRLNGELFSARVKSDIRLVRDGEAQSLTAIEATVPGVGRNEREAVMAALAALGRRVGAGLAPRIIRELMQAQAGTVRIDIAGADRDQIAHIRRFVESLDGVMRTAPLLLPGDRVSLAVVTQMTAQQLGAALQRAAGDAIQVVLAGDRVLYLRSAQAAGQGAGQQRPGTGSQAHASPRGQVGNEPAAPPQRPRAQPRVHWPRRPGGGR